MPTVLNTNPQNSQTEVYINQPITVTFDSNMNPAFITTGTFVVYGQGLAIVPGVVTYNVAAMTATFTPTQPFLIRAIYQVILVGGSNGMQTIPDSLGNISYLANYNFSFTTNDGRFYVTPPTLAPSGTPTVPYPSGVNYYTQFSVISTTPSNQQSQLNPSGIYTNINGLPTFTICFNKPVNIDSLMGSGVFCNMQNPTIIVENIFQDPWGGYPVDLSTSGTWSGTLWQVTFTFNSPSYFYTNEQVTVTIPQSTYSTDGTSMAVPYTFYFTTQMNPLYAGPNRVRMELGNIIADIPDDTIYRVMCHNSIMANWWGSVNQGSNDGGWINNIRPFVTTRATGFEAIVLRPSFTMDPVTGAPPTYVSEYVTSKTELDLLKARFYGLIDEIFLAGGPGASKALADLRITEGNGTLFANTIGPLLEKLEGGHKDGGGKNPGDVAYWLGWITGKNKWTNPLRAQYGRYDSLNNPRRSSFIDGISNGDYFRNGAMRSYKGVMGGGYGPVPPVNPNSSW